MSHASARPSPVPRHAPCTAAMVGIAMVAIRSSSGLKMSRRIASPSSCRGSASARSRPLQNARPSPRTTSARAPPVSAWSSASARSWTIARLIAFILSGRLSTNSATPPSTVSRTGPAPSDAGIRLALLGGQDLELARANGDAVLVEDVPAICHQAGLCVLVGLLDDLDVEVDGVVDPRRRCVAEAIGSVVGEDRRRVGWDTEAGAQREHHDPGRDALAEHRALGGDLVDVRVEPVAGQRAPVDDVAFGDGAAPRALGLADLQLAVGPIEEKPIHPEQPPVARLAWTTAGCRSLRPPVDDPLQLPGGALQGLGIDDLDGDGDPDAVFDLASDVSGGALTPVRRAIGARLHTDRQRIEPALAGEHELEVR